MLVLAVREAQVIGNIISHIELAQNTNITTGASQSVPERKKLHQFCAG